MTTVECMLSACRSWLNGRCKRTRIRIAGTKCLDFNQRRRISRNVTTTVFCDNRGCAFNTGGTCTKHNLKITATTCMGE